MEFDKHLLNKLERIYCEDSLKYIYERSERDSLASVEGLKGVLNISTHEVLQITQLLENMELIKTTPKGIYLSKKGKEIAVQVIRAHRLWETYLNWETDLSMIDLHKYAEQKEHELRGDSLDALDAHLGFPAMDPHGDPIPTREGEIQQEFLRSVSELNVGEIATITHIEDEPEEVFKKLFRYGFRLNQDIEVINRFDGQIEIRYQEENITLSTLMARNLHVIPRKEKKEVIDYITLAELKKNQIGWVVDISNELQGLNRRRLLDLGITPGINIRHFLSSTFGDPTIYLVRGVKIALRKEQAKQIHITRLEQGVTNG